MPFTYSPNYNSPVRRALTEAWRETQSFDLRQHLRFATAPIEVVRSWVDSVQLGAYSMLFGEAFERRFAESTYFYYSNRDRKASVDRLVNDLNINYTADFTLTAGERTDIRLCISNLVDSGLSNSAIVAEITRMITWLLPAFAGHITITICESARADIYLNVAAKAYTILEFGS